MFTTYPTSDPIIFLLRPAPLLLLKTVFSAGSDLIGLIAPDFSSFLASSFVSGLAIPTKPN